MIWNEAEVVLIVVAVDVEAKANKGRLKVCKCILPIHIIRNSRHFIEVEEIEDEEATIHYQNKTFFEKLEPLSKLSVVTRKADQTLWDD
jgi:hypothetical protein